MLYAVIRTDHDALHFVGKVDAYNLRTLEQHAREMANPGEAVRLNIEVDAADQIYLAGRGRRLLIRLSKVASVSLHIAPAEIAAYAPVETGRVAATA